MTEADLIETREDGGVLIVRLLPKRLDANLAPRFRAQITERIAAGQRTLVIDLGAVEFMDSSSLGALVSCMKAIGGRGELAVSGAQGAVLKLFKLTRLDRMLSLHESPEAAVASLRR